MPNIEPDFDDDFERAVADWRERYRLREDDAVLLLVELFRIHQRHWDDLRRRELPSFELVRADIAIRVGGPVHYPRVLRNHLINSQTQFDAMCFGIGREHGFQLGQGPSDDPVEGSGSGPVL